MISYSFPIPPAKHWLERQLEPLGATLQVVSVSGSPVRIEISAPDSANPATIAALVQQATAQGETQTKTIAAVEQEVFALLDAPPTAAGKILRIQRTLARVVAILGRDHPRLLQFPDGTVDPDQAV